MRHRYFPGELDKGQGRDVRKMDRVISSAHSNEMPHVRG